MREVFQERNYQLLWAGQGLALVGEQINLIALPWLALQLTGDAFALGSVLAVGGIPPALLTLVGGATTDRLSQRSIMLLADVIRLVLVVGLVVLVLSGSITLWVLYPVSLVFGLLSAFSMPAASSIVPTLVSPRHLQTGNALFQSLSQLAAFIGPALAGLLISALDAPGAGSLPPRASSTSFGIALAFSVYALGLLISIATLSAMHLQARLPRESPRPGADLLGSMIAGLAHAWKDPLLRILIAVLLALNLLLAGPLAVGIPMLAKLRLPEGAVAFGFIAAGFGGGNLIGSLLAGTFRGTRGLGLLFVAVILGFGVGLGIVGSTSSTWLAFLVLLIVGTGNGYLAIIVRTLLHRRSPREMLGRIMSVYLFAKAALVPVSQAASGAIIEISLEALFLGAGVLLILVAGGLALSPGPRLFQAQVDEIRQAAHGAAPSH